MDKADKTSTYSFETDTPVSGREERKKTGRYIAVCTAICITLLGLYQAMVQHTPVVAGLFAPAIIMFLYVFWVLYTASNTKKKSLLVELNGEEKTALTDVVVESQETLVTPVSTPKDTNVHSNQSSPRNSDINIDKNTDKNDRKLNRSYSIA